MKIQRYCFFAVLGIFAGTCIDYVINIEGIYALIPTAALVIILLGVNFFAEKNIKSKEKAAEAGRLQERDVLYKYMSDAITESKEHKEIFMHTANSILEIKDNSAFLMQNEINKKLEAENFKTLLTDKISVLTTVNSNIFTLENDILTELKLVNNIASECKKHLDSLLSVTAGVNNNISDCLKELKNVILSIDGGCKDINNNLSCIEEYKNELCGLVEISNDNIGGCKAYLKDISDSGDKIKEISEKCSDELNNIKMDLNSRCQDINNNLNRIEEYKNELCGLVEEGNGNTGECKEHLEDILNVGDEIKGISESCIDEINNVKSTAEDGYEKLAGNLENVVSGEKEVISSEKEVLNKYTELHNEYFKNMADFCEKSNDILSFLNILYKAADEKIVTERNL